MKAGRKPRVLIGPAALDPAESVSVVNRAFMTALADQYDFIPLPADRKLGGTKQRSLNLINGWYFLKQFLFWIWALIRYRPNIAHYGVTDGWAMEKGFIFMACARWLGVKTLGHLHSGLFIDFWNGLPPWRKRIALAELRKMDAFVCLSEGWRKNIRALIPLDETRLFVVNNPIDAAFEKAALEMPIDRPGHAILSLGALERTKGVMDLLQAAVQARDRVQFTLRYVGPERETGLVAAMEKFIREHEMLGRATVRGGVWGEEKIRVFNESNIFVLASYFENFPLVLLEAAAAGMAIITTPVGAAPEFFQDGVSAIFVEPGNVGQLTEAIQALAGDPARKLRLATAARAMFQEGCARARIMQSLDEVYRNLTTINHA